MSLLFRYCIYNLLASQGPTSRLAVLFFFLDSPLIFFFRLVYHHVPVAFFHSILLAVSP